MTERLNKLIKDESTKKKICHDTLKAYLKQDFNARRIWIDTVLPAQRLKSLLDKYPCFKYPTHVSFK